MRLLLLINTIACFLFTGCSIDVYQNFTQPCQNSSDIKPVFSDLGQPSYLFRSSIDFRGRHFSGLILIKQMEQQVFRVVFTTEVGLKIFDLEFNPTGMHVHYFLEEMNRKKFVSLIKNDLQLMLMNDINQENITAYCSEKADSVLYKANINGDANYYLTEKETGEIVRMDKTNGRKSNITILFADYHGSIPYSIAVSHRKVDLDLHYKYIER